MCVLIVNPYHTPSSYIKFFVLLNLGTAHYSSPGLISLCEVNYLRPSEDLDGVKYEEQVLVKTLRMSASLAFFCYQSNCIGDHQLFIFIILYRDSLLSFFLSFERWRSRRSICTLSSLTFCRRHCSLTVLSCFMIVYVATVWVLR